MEPRRQSRDSPPFGFSLSSLSICIRSPTGKTFCRDRLGPAAWLPDCCILVDPSVGSSFVGLDMSEEGGGMTTPNGRSLTLSRSQGREREHNSITCPAAVSSTPPFLSVPLPNNQHFHSHAVPEAVGKEGQVK